MSEHKRPFLVTVIGALYALAAILMIAAAAVMYLDILAVPAEFTDLGVGMCAIIGVIALIIAMGFLRGWSIMWYLGVIFAVIALLLEAASVVMGAYPALVMVVIELIILFYLFKKNVKSFFLD